MIQLKPDCTVDRMWDGTTRISLKQGLSDEIVNYIGRGEFQYIVLHDGNWFDFDRLLPYKHFIREVSIKTETLDWSVLSKFDSIEKLIVDGKFENCEIEFQNLKKLKSLKTYWNGGYKDLLKNLRSLKALSIINYGEYDLSNLGKMDELQYFEILNSRKLNSLAGVSNFQNLKYFAAEGCGSLHEISDVTLLQKLQFLSITKCKKQNNYEPLGKMQSLEELLLGGELSNVTWVQNLNRLIRFRMDCTLENGDIDFLLDMPKLQFVLFRNKRNLSKKVGDIQKHLEAKGFDQEELRASCAAFSDGF